MNFSIVTIPTFAVVAQMYFIALKMGNRTYGNITCTKDILQYYVYKRYRAILRVQKISCRILLWKLFTIVYLISKRSLNVHKLDWKKNWNIFIALVKGTNIPLKEVNMFCEQEVYNNIKYTSEWKMGYLCCNASNECGWLNIMFLKAK